MNRIIRLFSSAVPRQRPWTWGDLVALLSVTVLVYAGTRLAFYAPAVIRGPEISLSPDVLPLYAGLSFTRMLIAYGMSLIFSLWYGNVALGNQRAEQILIPLLDVLQSVPILSFLPVVLLGLSAFLSQNTAAELASIVLIFTSQTWNLTFAWYQSQKTMPRELREVAAIFQFNAWLRFKVLDLPFATIGLVWNSIMSWAGGWFFLMAAEIFTVGKKDFRLPGLGAYLNEAANRGDGNALSLGLITLIAMIIFLDQVLWRPLLAWSDRFKLETLGSVPAPNSWFYDAWRKSRVVADWVRAGAGLALAPLARIIGLLASRPAETVDAEPARGWKTTVFFIVGGAILGWGSYLAIAMLARVSLQEWSQIGLGLGATALRVLAAIIVALLWTVPVGVAIGMNPRLSAWLQPVAQVAASIPATALFPVLLLGLLTAPGGLNLTAVLLMLMGTQWYLLFNVIAGASAIPHELEHTAKVLRLNKWQRWRVLTLPALFPYIITGLITAGGGAWNASIVAEYTVFGGKVHSVLGIGSAIAEATASGHYPVLLAATLSMIIAVVLINRFAWRPLYRLAEVRFRMD